MTEDFFRSRLDGIVDMSHPPVVLASHLPWAKLAQATAPQFAHKDRPVTILSTPDLPCERMQLNVGPSNSGRPRLPRSTLNGVSH